MKYSYKYHLFFSATGIMGLMIVAMQVASGNTLHDTLHNNLHHKSTAPVILKAVKLVYFQEFPLQKKQNNSIASGCFSALSILPVFGFFVTPVLRCKESISLLRPGVTIERWEKSQKKNGFVDFNLTEFGINHVEAKIISVKPAPSGILYPEHGEKNINAVTGVFKRHSMDVGQYQFKTEGIKNMSKINVTNGHRFYVENKHGFIPIKKVQSADSLLTDDGRQVKLLCADKRQEGCGTPYHPENPVQVYNIEIDQRHIYFVGHDSILAHNPCGKYTRYVKIYHDNRRGLKFKGYVNKENYEYYKGIEYDIHSNKIYEGTWKDGKYHEGTAYDHTGKIYEGAWKDGKYHGWGKAFKKGKLKTYEGFYVNGKREGMGTVFYRTGERAFYGMFKDDLRTGHGTRYHPNGNILYEGELLGSFQHGYGVSYDENGVVEYAGICDYGKRRDMEESPVSEENEEQHNPWPDFAEIHVR